MCVRYFGGVKSALYTKGKVNTDMAYSWRDCTIGITLDCFYDQHEAADAQHSAAAWIAQNDADVLTVFDPDDRRLLWGSWGDHDMAKESVWRRYHDSRDKYERLCRVKGEVDPKRIFSANSFCVGGAKPPKGKAGGMQTAGGGVPMAATAMTVSATPSLASGAMTPVGEAQMMKALLERRAAYFTRVVSRQPERRKVEGNAALVKHPQQPQQQPPSASTSTFPRYPVRVPPTSPPAAAATAAMKKAQMQADGEEHKEQQ